MKKTFQDSISMSIRIFWYGVIASAIFGIFKHIDFSSEVKETYMNDGLLGLLGLYMIAYPIMYFTISVVYSFLIGVRVNRRLDNSSPPAKFISLENFKLFMIIVPYIIGSFFIVILWMSLFSHYAEILFQYVPYVNEIGISSVVWISIIIVIYFIPIMVAHDRHHPNIIAISIVNLLLGWTVIGWFFALVWALMINMHKSTKY